MGALAVNFCATANWEVFGKENRSTFPAFVKGSMMKYRLALVISAVSFLAACGAQPSPAMFGAMQYEVTRDGRQFVVFIKDNKFEVIRLGYAARGEHARIRQTMLALIPEVTGCSVNLGSVQGDSGLIRGSAWCPSS